MANIKKFLDNDGLTTLQQLNNDTLQTVVNIIDETKADKTIINSLTSRIEQLEQKLFLDNYAFIDCEKINNDWGFLLISNSPTANEYNSEAAQTALKVNAFKLVNLPHDWSIYNAFNQYSPSTYEGGYLDGGDAWYKKKIFIRDNLENRYFLYFDGIYMESDILVNNIHLCTHKNGYSSFMVEITNAVKINEENEILIYVKNRQISSRWYSGSGIYRDVLLLRAGKVGFKQQSLKITMPNLETEYPQGYCNTHIEYSIDNTINENKTVRVEASIKHVDQELLHRTFTINTIANTISNESFDFIIGDPKLWDEYNGQYYTVTLEMYDDQELLISKLATPFGYRFFRFDPNTGFWLNGKNIKLRGACVHHDLGILGAEINQSAIDRQILKLKDAGFNAIRLTHNPASTQYVNACMRYGIMCVEEAFDCWTIPKKTYDYARFFLEYSKSDLQAMVRKDLNNPCIIMWSLGNEIYDTRSGSAEQVLQDPIVTVTNLKNWVKELDTSRPCTMGLDQVGDATVQLVMNELDVQGINYNVSLYNTLHTQYPNWCIYGSETTSALSSRCEYKRDDYRKQCSSYDDDVVGWGNYAYSQLNELQASWLAGGFVWTGWDYIGEPTPFNSYPSRSSYFGAIDIAGIPKDIYYLYQSTWTDKPMCHIVPMDWNSWDPQQSIKVMVYSNASYIKLYLNSQLVDTCRSKSFEWYNRGAFVSNIPFAKGRLVANAYDANDNLIAQDVVYTARNPTKLILKTEKLHYKDSDDLLFVEIDVADIVDHVCCMADNIVTMTAEGGTVIGIDNGNATSVELYRSATKPVFHGKAIGVIKPNVDSTEVIITATSTGLDSDTITITKSDMTVYNKEVKPIIDATEPYENYMVPCESLVLSETEITITDSLAHEIVSTVTPEDCFYPVIWESANTDIALVSDAGWVTGISDGTTTITATCGPHVVSCTVNVALVKPDNMVEWTGEASLPDGMSVVTDHTVFNLDESTGKYYITTDLESSDAMISFDRLTTHGYLEFEFDCSDWTSGRSWNMGIVLQAAPNYRHTVFNQESATLYTRYTAAGYNTVDIGMLKTGTNIIKLDNSFSEDPKNIRVYLNNVMIHENFEYDHEQDNHVQSYVWVNGPAYRITAMRYVPLE